MPGAPVVFVKVTRKTLAEVVPYADANGFDLEIVDLIQPSAFWHELDAIADVYADVLSDRDGVVSLHGPFIDLYLHSLDPKVAELSRAALFRTLDLSDRLGVDHTIFHGNYIPLIDDDGYRRHWIDVHAAFCREAADRYRTVVTFENLWDRDPELFCELFDRVGSQSIGMCLDIGHCTVHSALGIDVWLAALGPHVKLLHVNDNDGLRDLELPPGQGLTDWQQFTDGVRRHCDSPHVSLELSTLQGVGEAATYMRDNRVYPFC